MRLKYLYLDREAAIFLAMLIEERIDPKRKDEQLVGVVRPATLFSVCDLRALNHISQVLKCIYLSLQTKTVR